MVILFRKAIEMIHLVGRGALRVLIDNDNDINYNHINTINNNNNNSNNNNNDNNDNNDNDNGRDHDDNNLTLTCSSIDMLMVSSSIINPRYRTLHLNRFSISIDY